MEAEQLVIVIASAVVIVIILYAIYSGLGTVELPGFR